ncbi:anti-sigma factor RsiW [Aminobacter niigataensis]|uniref:Anti-sigma factor RsiW n=1 Tax=Aminobacter niigataensis TaxID=83265 RepID=A0ABR6L2V0_9HYPH|nr:anti-sigma factor [Aminobacter niigataensis]MBB4651114.1 anti-sigma factor RsiW [Aminobacter niigataensis]
MSAAEKMSRRDEIETLLPFYLNGTLEGAELATVEDWLASDPAAPAALEAAEAEFSGTMASNEAIRPPADALSRFSRLLDAEAGPVREPQAQSLLARAWERFMGVPVGVAWAAAAALLAFIVVQGVVAPSGTGSDIQVAGTGAEQSKLPFALVTFKPDARMADIAALLGDNGAAIIDGPTASGVFRIAIPAETVADYDRIVGLIAAAPFADTVTVGRKPAG